MQFDLLSLYGAFADEPPGPERTLVVVHLPLDEVGRTLLAAELRGVPGVVEARVPPAALEVPEDWRDGADLLLSEPGGRVLVSLTVRARDPAVVDAVQALVPEADLVGAPALDVAHADASRQTQLQLGLVLVPGLLLLVAVALRSLLHGLLVVGSVGIGTSMLAGAMGWLGYSLGGPNLLLLPLVIVLGVADSVHLYGQLPGRTPLQAFRAVLVPCALTSLTTGLAFLTLATSPVPAVRTFGVLAAVGMLLALLAGLLFPVSVLLLTGIRPAGGPRGAGLVGGLTRVPAGFVGLVALAAVLATGQARTDLVVGGELPLGDPTLATFHRVDAELNGVLPAVIRLDTGRPNGALEVGAARDLLRARQTLAHDPAVGRTRSYADVLDLALGERAEHRLRGPLAGARYRPVRDRALRALDQVPLKLFDEDRSAFLVHVRFRDVGARGWARVLDRLRGAGFDVQVEGHVALAVTAWRAVVPELVRVVLATLASVLLVVTVWTRSWRGALGALGVVGSTTATVLGVLVVLGQPLNHANVFVAALAIGLATDGWIHVARPGATVEEVGPALVSTALVLGGGFVLLATAPLPSLRATGLALAASAVLNVLYTVALARVLGVDRPADRA